MWADGRGVWERKFVFFIGCYYLGGLDVRLGKKICVFHRVVIARLAIALAAAAGLSNNITICLGFDQYLLRIISVFDDWVLSI